MMKTWHWGRRSAPHAPSGWTTFAVPLQPPPHSQSAAIANPPAISIDKEQSSEDHLRGIYCANKSQKLKENHGGWYVPDPCTRCTVSPHNVSATAEYYRKDGLERCLQSPEQKDVVSVVPNGQKTFEQKRFMTRSIERAFRL